MARDGRSGWRSAAQSGSQATVEAALRTAYPNCRLGPAPSRRRRPPVVLRLKKHAEFIKRAKVLDRFEHEREPPVNRLMTVMGACAEPRRSCSWR